MAKINNKGFSLVEVIVAIAIFAILIIPLTTQLISAVNTNTKTTKKQYAVEMAEELMESFKVCDLKDAITISDGDAASSSEYVFSKTASENKTITLPDASATVVPYTVDTYECNDIAIGGNFETYTCTVTVNSAAYAVSSKGYVYDRENNACKVDGDGNYIKTNPATGTIRNLDNKQAAIITGATYTGQGSGVNENNLDNQAFEHFRDVKLDLLKENKVYYNQYLSGSDYFSSDYFNKYTTIKISKVSSKYMIECIVRYEDQTQLAVISAKYATGAQNVYYPDSAYGNGVVYRQEFEELPPIYLLYAPAIYNGAYCPRDYISIDNSLASDVTPKVYIFETASEIKEDYEDIICQQFGISDLNQLVYQSSKYATNQKKVSVRVNLEAGDADKLKVYANFNTDKANSSIDVLDMSKDENDSVYLYDISVTLTDSEGHKTTVSGTRGKE